MAQEGGIKAKGKALKMITIIVVLVILCCFAFTYMFNHYTTEDLAKFALIKYLILK